MWPTWNFGASPTNVKRIAPLPMVGFGAMLFGIIFFAENALWTVAGLGMWIEMAVAAILGVGLSWFGLSWYHMRFDVKDD